MSENHVATFRTKHAGRTVDYYQRLADAGLAPKIIDVTEDELEVVRHLTLKSWLNATPSIVELEVMKEAILRLLLAAHATGICHRDAHIGNIVVDDDGRPLLIDPALAAPSVNEHCYDLEGPKVSNVPVPGEHVIQSGDHACGVWWGSPVKHRSLEQVFGAHA